MASPTRKPAVIEEEPTDLEAAAALVLEKEEQRIRRAEVRAVRRQRKREKEQLAAVQRMQQSIELMKWCMVIIAGIMLLGVVAAVWTLRTVHGEVVKIQAEVENVRPDVERVINEVNEVVDGVERVREALNNPMRSIGSAFGKELDDKLESYLGTKLGGD